MKRKYDQEVRAIKWNPQYGRTLAIGMVTDDGGSVVEFYEWEENIFKCKLKERCEVSSLNYTPNELIGF